MIFATLPIWLSALLVVVLPTALAMAGTFHVRRWVGYQQLSTNNEVAGFKFATIGVIYAVLLAFAVIVVWERFSDAEDQVVREAGAAATLYRLADGLDGEPGPTVRRRLTAYLESAVTQDWPAMEDGRADPATTRAVGDLYAAALTFKPADLRGATLMQELLRQIDYLTEARRARLVKAAGAVPGLLWYVLFVGAFVTVGFTFFFGNENVLAQSAMTGALTLLVFSGLFVIVTIDKPFAGVVKVHPEPLIRIMATIGGPPGSRVEERNPPAAK
jgi:hypothetical protein